MTRKKFVFYQKTDPFPGWIRFNGFVDPTEPPDGSTWQERLDELLIKYPDSGIHLYSLGKNIDKEAQKFDQGTSALVPLEVGDITPKAQLELDKIERENDIASNLPSWNQVKNNLNSIKSNAAAATNLTQLKLALAPLLEFEKNHARITYWLAKNKKD